MVLMAKAEGQFWATSNLKLEVDGKKGGMLGTDVVEEHEWSQCQWQALPNWVSVAQVPSSTPMPEFRHRR